MHFLHPILLFLTDSWLGENLILNLFADAPAKFDRLDPTAYRTCPRKNICKTQNLPYIICEKGAKYIPRGLLRHIQVHVSIYAICWGREQLFLPRGGTPGRKSGLGDCTGRYNKKKYRNCYRNIWGVCKFGSTITKYNFFLNHSLFRTNIYNFLLENCKEQVKIAECKVRKFCYMQTTQKWRSNLCNIGLSIAKQQEGWLCPHFLLSFSNFHLFLCTIYNLVGII